MELRDLIVTPIILLLVYTGAYFIRPYVTDSINWRYFFPALTVRIFGAIALGFIYQFYYNGGDTFNYHTHGSRVIWEIFLDDPLEGFRLIFGVLSDAASIYKYSNMILFFRDPSSYFIIRITALFDLFTFSTYSATAIFFATTSFAGSWAFFITFYRKYPHLHFSLALATFFIPSLFFWGSGILKDTVILAVLSFATYFIDRIFFQKKWSFLNLLFLLLSLFVIFQVRKFILQAFIPAALLWFFFKNLMSMRSIVLRALIFPVIIGMLGYSILLVVTQVGEGDARYSINNLAKTAKIIAYDIGFYTGRDAGSGYSLGEQDGTITNMIEKAPLAINVTFFRPYLWEVKNPLMLLSAIESFFFLVLVIHVVFIKRGTIFSGFRNPDIVFLLTFSVIMAFAVGLTSYNFGTLSRYKIVLLPFFLAGLCMLKSDKIDQQAIGEESEPAQR